MDQAKFLAKLPATISHFSYGECRLKILEDNRIRKAACYINKDRYKAGFRYARSWADLYKELTQYLKKEGYIK